MREQLMRERSERVYWTEEEHDELALAVADGLLRHPERGMLTILQGVIGQWPQARQRPINTLVAVPWLAPKVQTLLGEPVRYKDQLQRTTEECTQLRSRVAELVNQNNQLAGVQIDQEKVIRETPTQRLLAEVLGRLGGGLAGIDAFLSRIAHSAARLEAALLAASHKAPDHPPHLSNGAAESRGESEPPPPRKKKIPRALVCGPLNDQFARLQKLIGANRCELVGWFQEDGKSATRKIPQVDRAFLLTKFCNHKTTDKLYAALPRSDVTILPSSAGYTALEAAIERWLETQT